jgi:hypothetical protein
LEKAVRAGAITMDAGLSYSTNPGNLQLQLADFLESQPAENEAEIVR